MRLSNFPTVVGAGLKPALRCDDGTKKPLAGISGRVGVEVNAFPTCAHHWLRPTLVCSKLETFRAQAARVSTLQAVSILRSEE
jgi:hypothetical protein